MKKIIIEFKVEDKFEFEGLLDGLDSFENWKIIKAPKGWYEE